ncbi:hypothetical protein HYU18_01370 [Candidatus Woesearchaeota archaeon]|nr:hypothetical protein [Candidatus Woesearchaeota archaeon]
MTARLSMDYASWLVGVLVVAVAAFVLFGFAGFRSVAAVAVFFVVPVWLLLRKSGVDLEEKLFFSLFIGLGLFPLLVWAVNQVLPSFRLSIAAAFIAVAAASFFLPVFLRQRRKQQ